MYVEYCIWSAARRLEPSTQTHTHRVMPLGNPWVGVPAGDRGSSCGFTLGYPLGDPPEASLWGMPLADASGDNPAWGDLGGITNNEKSKLFISETLIIISSIVIVLIGLVLLQLAPGKIKKPYDKRK